MVDSWIDSFYRFVRGLGYPHPIHPALVHMAIGLVVGAFVFVWVALLFARPPVARTARHCTILAFLFWFPVVLFGLMDWQHFLRGAWLFPIKMKLILTGILFVLVSTGLFLGSKGKEGARALLVVYTLSFLTVVGLGWFGAQLVYTNAAQPASEPYRAGERIFQERCNGCHPHGGNVIKPQMPIINSPELKDPTTFTGYIRHPIAPMPVFSPAQISDQQADELYQYLVHVLEKQK
jgi:mono/diheme cytochrome c family protein